MPTAPSESSPTAGESSLGRLVAILLLAVTLVAVHVIVDSRLYDVSQLPRLLAILVGLAGGIPAVLCLPPLARRLDTAALREPLVAVFAAYLLACGASLAVALNASAGFTDLFRTLAAFLVLCLAVLALPLDARWRLRLLEMATIATLVTVVVGGWRLAPLIMEGWPGRRAVEEAMLEGMMSNVNLYAGFLLLLVPWCLCGASLLTGPWRGLSAGVGGAAVAVLVVVQSRAAWLAAVAATVVTVATLLRHRRELSVSPPICRLLVGATIAAGAAGLAVAGLALTDSATGQAIRRLVVSRPHQAQGPSDGGRTMIWGLTLEMIADHPVGGVGAGNFPIRLQEYYGGHGEDLPPDFSRLSSDNWLQPHNDFLQVGAEQGLLGLLPFVAIFATALLAIRTVLMRSPSPTDARLATASLAAIVGYLVFSCLDFPLARVSHQVVLAVHLAVIVLIKHEVQPGSRRPLAIPCWLVVPPLVAVIALGIGYAAAAIAQEHAVMTARRAEHEGDWEGMRTAARRATTPWKTLDPLGVPVAFLEGMADLRLGDLPAATICFERALAANPNRLYVLQNLGAAYAQAGRLDDAIAAFALAADRYPSNVAVRHNLSAALIDAGRFPEAIAVIEDVPEPLRTDGMREALDYARAQAAD